MNDTIKIEFVSGGFILSVKLKDSDTESKEVFVSPGKLNKRVKDLINDLSLVLKTKGDQE